MYGLTMNRSISLSGHPLIINKIIAQGRMKWGKCRRDIYVIYPNVTGICWENPHYIKLHLWVCSCLHSAKFPHPSRYSGFGFINQNVFALLKVQPHYPLYTQLSLLLTHLEFQSKELVTQSFCSSYLPTLLFMSH